MTDKKLCEFVPAEQIKNVIENKFKETKVDLLRLIPGSDVHHVGSSAVKGALTKRDLDITVLVSSKDFNQAVVVLRNKFEPIHEHRFWIRNKKAIFTKQLSGDIEMIDIVLVLKDSEFDKHVRYRDLLKNDSELLKAYNKMKMEYHGKSYDEYEECKFKFWDKVDRL